MRRLTASATAIRLAFRPLLQSESIRSKIPMLADLRMRGPSQAPLRPLSYMAVEHLLTWEETSSSVNDAQHRDCDPHTCEDDNGVIRISSDTNYMDTNNEGASLFPCGSSKHEDDFGQLPPPLPEPAYSVHKRILPAALTGLSSKKGREYLLQALVQNTAESYWALMEQFVNQSDPAFCGITTLLMVLNAMCIDPNVRWRGGWRFFGSEEVLLDRCCLSMERISRVGVTLEEFRLLALCHGLGVEMKRPFLSDDLEKDTTAKQHDRPTECNSLEAFRDDIRKILNTPNSKSHLVVSFSRASLKQTGDGHFSPIAAYHEETDQVLVLDVARFKVRERQFSYHACSTLNIFYFRSMHPTGCL